MTKIKVRTVHYSERAQAPLYEIKRKPEAPAPPKFSKYAPAELPYGWTWKERGSIYAAVNRLGIRLEGSNEDVVVQMIEEYENGK
jgi:hypothetical protein